MSRTCQCCGRGLGQDDICQCQVGPAYSQTDRLVLSALAGLKTIEQTVARHEKRLDFHQERLDKLDESNRHHYQRIDAHSRQLEELAPVVDAEFDTTVPQGEHQKVLEELEETRQLSRRRERALAEFQEFVSALLLARQKCLTEVADILEGRQ